MGHYAKINPEGIVTNVIVADQTFIDSYIDTEPGKFVQTSYNTFGGVHYDPVTKQPSADQSKALRKNYAGKGFTYDEQRDAFIPPKLHASWVLNETTCIWEPPVAMPIDEKSYTWNESNQSWDEVSGQTRTTE
jgi:hypothetical protein